MIKYRSYYLVLFEDFDSHLVEVEKVEFIDETGVYYSGTWQLDNLEWGELDMSLRQNDEKFQVPQAIKVYWKESATNKKYDKEISLRDTEINNEDIIFVGLSHFGDVSVWLKSQGFIDLIFKESSIESLFHRMMKQYKYRLLLVLRDGDASNISRLKVKRFDGTLNEILVNGIAARYQLNGAPQTFKIELDCNGQYSVNVWFVEEKIIPIFERFYGAHPETKADFIIRMDVEKGEYALALFRQGLKEPVTIPEEAFQVIVFKDKFECYRSANYNQPKGAWIW